MIAKRQDACAHNNALWCDAVLKSAGATTRFHSGFWQAVGTSLPLYPNMVTLSARPTSELTAALEAVPSGTAVKDSFDALDLRSSGFQKLFSGVWLFRPPQSSRRSPVSSSWHKVTHAEGLKKWAAAWNKDETLQRQFSPKLLETSLIEFAAIQDNGAIKAGAVFNKGPDLGGIEVLGVSNVFCRKSWLYSALQGLLEPFPHKPVCTYEADGDVLPVYHQLGFEECGQLSIWLKN